jgi:nucleotide-binding universal stress UspA family protein
MPAAAARFDPSNAAAVRRQAEDTAAEGSALAEAAGFRSRALTVEAAPTWKGIVNVSEEHEASVIVLGSHGRTGLRDVLLGSVAQAVAAHSRRSVLITHRRS